MFRSSVFNLSRLLITSLQEIMSWHMVPLEENMLNYEAVSGHLMKQTTMKTLAGTFKWFSLHITPASGK